jgi:CRP-like cAMP-binding protein
MRIARLFEVRRALTGTKILEAGKRADGLYLPLHGRVVTKKADGTLIGHMELGHTVGQESLLTSKASLITVEAVSDVIVLRMPMAQFSDLLLHRPDVVQHIQVIKRTNSLHGYSFVSPRR